MNTFKSFFITCGLATVGAVGCGAAIAAGHAANADAEQRYRQDMAVCASGQSNQHADTCRIEARNALAEARRGGLTDAAPGQYQRNSNERCLYLKGDERKDCQARMLGLGNASGSVGAGGILRQTVTTVPAE